MTREKTVAARRSAARAGRARRRARQAGRDGTRARRAGRDGAPDGRAATRTLGPLGGRLFAAFVIVALSSVAVLTAAALVGTDRGLSAARRVDRDRVAARTAQAAGAAYLSAGGWRGADLGRAQALAEAAGATLIVLDADGAVVSGAARAGMGTGMGTGPGTTGGKGGDATGGMGISGGGAGRPFATAPVIVSGRQVGTVRLRYAGPASSAGEGTGRDVAWEWIAFAAVAALGVALAMSWFVTRRLSGPLGRLTRAARAIAAGDRSARSGVRAPGELGELAEAFDRMAGEVDRTERARRHLAADAAHELRTPLTALQAGLEELRDGLADPDPVRLAALHDQALRLGRIVDDLGELAAAESATVSMRMREVDLGELARTALASREPELRAAGLDVHADLAEGVVVRGDPDRLYQALGNLLANAARYCRPGDAVTVAVHGADGGAVAQVRDTGPGIPASDVEHVFDRLWRGRSSSRVSGSGIGLAVVRELVAAHGGTVTAESPPTGGAAFTIRLRAVPGSVPWVREMPGTGGHAPPQLADHDDRGLVNTTEDL